MIQIKVYKNGWEIIGHDHPTICYSVSLWHWTASNIILGWRHGVDVKEYSSHKDNKENPNEGYSYLTFVHHDPDLDWLFKDMVESIEDWVREIATNVKFERIDGLLVK